MILTALLLFAAQSPDAAAPAAKPVPDPDKKICRREIATGSNMSRKICHTRAEWTRQTGETVEAAGRMRGAVRTAVPRAGE